LFGGVAKATEAVGFHDGFVHSGHNRQTMTTVMGLRENHQMAVGTTLTHVVPCHSHLAPLMSTRDLVFYPQILRKRLIHNTLYSRSNPY
jgi:hypothetical protein